MQRVECSENGNHRGLIGEINTTLEVRSEWRLLGVRSGVECWRMSEDYPEVWWICFRQKKSTCKVMETWWSTVFGDFKRIGLGGLQGTCEGAKWNEVVEVAKGKGLKSWSLTRDCLTPCRKGQVPKPIIVGILAGRMWRTPDCLWPCCAGSSCSCPLCLLQTHTQVYGKLSLVPKLGSDSMNTAVGINRAAVGKVVWRRNWRQQY